jgi:hypothetical protein
MKRIALAATISLFAVSAAMAQDATCAAKAVGSDGKPLAGAAKTSFLTKCKQDACAPKAVDSPASRRSWRCEDQLHEEMPGRDRNSAGLCHEASPLAASS